ncbi:hypothetical protein GJ496_004082 [Pomphorhynchus laevis]|nr:hypothetical protein GJ496_004082 [Pomphorhynchus laevis]
MTAGTAIILGSIGRNFAAGLAVGVAYVYDKSKIMVLFSQYQHRNAGIQAVIESAKLYVRSNSAVPLVDFGFYAPVQLLQRTNNDRLLCISSVRIYLFPMKTQSRPDWELSLIDLEEVHIESDRAVNIKSNENVDKSVFFKLLDDDVQIEVLIMYLLRLANHIRAYSQNCLRCVALHFGQKCRGDLIKRLQLLAGNICNCFDYDYTELPCDGLALSYSAWSDKLNEEFNEEFIWQCHMINYTSNNRCLLLSDILNGSNIRAIVVILMAIKFNSWFNGVSWKGTKKMPIEVVDALADLFKHSKHLCEFAFTDNCLKSDQCARLIKSLIENSRCLIESIQLSGIQMNEKAIDLLNLLLQNACNLHALNINQCNLNSKLTFSLLRNLSVNLTSLHLADNDLRFADDEMLYKSISSFKRLQKFDISNTYLNLNVVCV